jgi:hypothetical protein
MIRHLSLAWLLALVLAVSAADNVRFTDLQPLGATPVEAAALADSSGQLHELDLPFTPYNTSRPKLPRRMQLVSDRYEYLADDPLAQFLATFFACDYAAGNVRLTLELYSSHVTGKGDRLISYTTTTQGRPKLAFRLPLTDLAPGDYRIELRVGRARLPPCLFRKSAQARVVTPFPADGVPLLVHAQGHVPGATWPITTGVPLPRHLLRTTDRLVLLENGQPVPAQFTPRAWWYPDRGELKWVGLDFQARYDNGQPREYRLQLLPEGQAAPAPTTPLQVQQTGELITVNTGVMVFSVHRRAHAGLEEVRLISPEGALGEPLLASGGGAFLRDERNFDYTSARDEQTSVTIEEAGPLRVTILATGWYTSSEAERTCLYQTRYTAFAGQPRIDVHHRTVITFDTDKKLLRELGFALRPVGALQYGFGVDGKTVGGALPEKETVWLHQDKDDHLRLGQGEAATGEGRRSDGWVTVKTTRGSIAVSVRNLWQLFPKELEVGRDGLYLHAWPRHGHDAFTDAEELDVRQIHKLRYAHEGKVLDLSFPLRYFEAFGKFAKEVPSAPLRDGRFLEQQDINALTGNAQGTAVSTFFSLRFAGGDPETPAAHAALYQQNPHAITDPLYNGLTEVEGRFAGRQPARWPTVEPVFETGFRGFTMSVDLLTNYGMWIWPDTHNNWSLGTMMPQAHRWWLHSHYQGVWEGSFLYFRSGLPMLATWAADNYEHFANIGTVNYDDPQHPMQGHLKGANYHTKGFTPWGSPRHLERTSDDYVEVGAHFLNPDAHLFRYLLVGDHRALDLAQGWFDSLNRVALPPERSREACNTLGELVSYYETTWDPQTLPAIRDLADDMLSRPWAEIPAHPGHTFYHDRWVQRYWALTRDPVLWQRLVEVFPADKAAAAAGHWYFYPQLRALLWRETGNRDYLQGALAQLAQPMRGVYVNPDDPELTGFGGRAFFFPTHSWGQMVPYYLQALADAGIEIPTEEAPPAPIAKVVTPAKDDKPGDWYPLGTEERKRGWFAGYLMAFGADPKVELELSGYTHTAYGANDPFVCTFLVRDAKGKVLLDTTVLAKSKRPSVKLVLDPATSSPPWQVCRGNYGLLRWTGPAERVIFAPLPDAAAQPQ